MIAQASTCQNPGDGLRPFDMRRDLLQLANLIELSFQSELDQTANPIVAEMRRLARSGPVLWLFDATHWLLSSLLRGYVWIANGQLVGNVSLNRDSEQHDLWSISNVAVHPEFRGHGIARQLMKAAIQEARQKGARLVILEVQKENAPAHQLYKELGFQIYDSVAELSLPEGKYRKQWLMPPLPLRGWRPEDWPGIENLLRAVTPKAAQEVRPLISSRYRPSMRRQLERWLDDLMYLRQSQDWLLEENGQIIALLQITAQYTKAAHRLQIFVHPHYRGAIEEKLIASGLNRLAHSPDREVTSTVSTSHVEALQAFHQNGFRTIRLLDLMKLNLCDNKEKA
ncbi:MAG: GNAT family N-acetyltransferase [Anaerolineae bacterium]